MSDWISSNIHTYVLIIKNILRWSWSTLAVLNIFTIAVGKCRVGSPLYTLWRFSFNLFEQVFKNKISKQLQKHQSTQGMKTKACARNMWLPYDDVQQDRCLTILPHGFTKNTTHLPVIALLYLKCQSRHKKQSNGIWIIMYLINAFL